MENRHKCQGEGAKRNSWGGKLQNSQGPSGGEWAGGKISAR